MNGSARAALGHSPEHIMSFVSRLLTANGSHDGPERRSHGREPLSIPVQAYPLNREYQPDGEVFSAVTRDISGGGIGLLCKRPVLAKYLEVELTNPTHHPEILRVAVSVRHCTPLNGYYYVGGRFIIDAKIPRHSQENIV